MSKSLIQYLENDNSPDSLIENTKTAYESIHKLFTQVKSNKEFEFIFTEPGKGAYLTREKYVHLVKYLNARAKRDKLTIIGPEDTVEVRYNGVNANYRCTLEGKAIDKTFKVLDSYKNHVIFSTLVKMSKKNPNIVLDKKANRVRITVNNFKFRVALSDEVEPTKQELDMLSKLSHTERNKILFRYKQRVALVLHGSYPSDEYVKIDLTLTRNTKNYKSINTSPPEYELEMEYKSNKSNEKLLAMMIKELELLIKIIQQSNFLISQSESNEVLNSYRSLLSLPPNTTNLSIRNPVCLEIQYLITLPNKYAVTDKIDGERAFLIILDNHVYFISNSLAVLNTGIVLPSSMNQYNNTIMDGELVFIKENNRFLYLLFDCLMYKGEDVRRNPDFMMRMENCYDIIKKCFTSKNQKGIVWSRFEPKVFNLEQKIQHHKDELKQLMLNIAHDLSIDTQYPLIRCNYFIGATGARD